MAMGLLQGFFLCAVLAGVLALPQGPDRRPITGRDIDEDDTYKPWVDANNECVLKNYVLPMRKCVRIYGQDVVDSWPRRKEQPGTLNTVPGSIIGR